MSYVAPVDSIAFTLNEIAGLQFDAAREFALR